MISVQKPTWFIFDFFILVNREYTRRLAVFFVFTKPAITRYKITSTSSRYINFNVFDKPTISCLVTIMSKLLKQKNEKNNDKKYKSEILKPFSKIPPFNLHQLA